MRTKLTIVTIVVACIAAVLTIFAAATLWFGWFGLAGCFLAAVLIIGSYARIIRPWHSSWGATREEVSRPMPGDEVISEAASTTRAISIDCSPHDLWPWLVQIGYGRGGWYSYDWIDNDGKPSATQIEPHLQRLSPGDTIQMLPGFGPKVLEVVPYRHFVAGDGEGGTWCLAIYPDGESARLVSRWRQAWKKNNVAAWFFISIADPGAFIMERKMLLGIKKRAEASRSITTNVNSAGSSNPREEVA